MAEQPEKKQPKETLASVSIARWVSQVNTLRPGATNVRQLKYFGELWGLHARNADGTFNPVRAIKRLLLYVDEKDAKPIFDKSEYLRKYKDQQKKHARDIGELPKIKDKGLRKACDEDLLTFMQKCFPDKFYLPFSTAHKTLILDVQRLVEVGGMESYACERGFGKTQISLAATSWGASTGRTKFALIIGANADMATAQRDGIKRRFETSPELFELYPEICYPMRQLAGSTKQTATYKGELLRMRTRPHLVLPYIPGSVASEAVIACTGIDSGSIRGLYYDRVDGTTVRPDFVMIDDPQDDETARQPTTIKNRSIKIRKAVKGLRGPGQKLGIAFPCTCIDVGCLASEFTDMEIRPEWGGRRIKAMPSMPDDLDSEFPLWHQYDELRREDLASGDKTRARATEFYRDHMEAMKAGAVITWPERVEVGCVDALQSLMDLYLADPLSFEAEQQQNPQGAADLSSYLNVKQLTQRFNGLKRRQLTPDVVKISTGIDVQEHLLYWMQIGWSNSLTGYMLDWGTFPRQPIADFHHMKPPRTITQWLRQTYPLQTFSWEDGLDLAIRELMKTLPKYDDQTAAEFGTTLIDWRWHKVRSLIGEIADEDEYKTILLPAGGLMVGGNDVPLNERKFPKTSGSYRVSTDVHWYYNKRKKDPRNLLFDANYYRSQLQKGLAIQPGMPGSITFNSTLADPVIANHLGAKSVRVSVDTKREVEIWTNRPSVDQDHWLDCAVMCRVGAEVDGHRKSTKRGSPGGKKKKTQAEVNAMLAGRRG